MVLVYNFADIFSKYEEEKEKSFLRYEQQSENPYFLNILIFMLLPSVLIIVFSGKKDKVTLSELVKTCADKIAIAEGILKKKKQVYDQHR